MRIRLRTHYFPSFTNARTIYSDDLLDSRITHLEKYAEEIVRGFYVRF
jgi:hypothetical protein